ncbi:MAG: glycosyltransferase family 4 protein, partial [Desulfobulbaceae bacterium]|nr:glycosyltransferase family 4 protein [Desulfobulbaceae bacterium]
MKDPTKRRHILCVASNFPRWKGDSTTPFVLHLAQDLQKLGWEITVLAPHAPGTQSNETLDGVRIKRFRYLWPERLETVCYHGGMLVNLRNNPFDYIKIFPFLLLETFNIIRELLTQQYSLLHTHCLLPQGFTGVIANLICKIPHITTIHGSDIFALRNPLFLLCKRFTLKHVDATTVNSSVAEHATQELLSKPLRILRRIPMGVAQTLAVPRSTSAKLR